MEESVTYQAIVTKGRNEGIEIGRAEGMRSLLLEQGKQRFKKTAPSRIRKHLNAIEDVKLLMDIAKQIFDAKSWEELVPPDAK